MKEREQGVYGVRNLAQSQVIWQFERERERERDRERRVSTVN
jgi:hypothetical protein